MDLNALKSNLDTTESKLAQYTSNLPSEIQSQVQSAYTPLLTQSLDTTKNMMSDYLGNFMETTGMGPGMSGTTAYDLSPTQKMGVVGRELGRMGGQLNASIKYSDYLGGQMQDMYQKALQAAQMGQQNLADQYSRQMQLYQMAWQEAEAEKDRAASLAAARAAASGYGYDTGSGITELGGGNNEQDDDIIVETSPYKKVTDYATGTDLSKGGITAGKVAGYATNPIWSTVKTGAGFLGNLLGNIQVPKRDNMSLLDKLLNR